LQAIAYFAGLPYLALKENVVRPLYIVLSTALSAILTAASTIDTAFANPTSTRGVPNANASVSAPPLLRRHTSNLRVEQTLGTPFGNVKTGVGPDGQSAAQTFSLPSGSSRTSFGLGGLHATVIKPQAAVITCTLKVNNPHESGHGPGNVNVTGSITCSAPVSFIDLGVGLYLNNYLISSSYKPGYGTYVTTNAAATCLLPGIYAGGAVGSVTFPPGFVPPWGNFGGLEVYSPDFYLTC